MYYVVQVHTGDEERCMQECCLRIDKEILRECFIPHYEEKRKINGTWMTQERVLFPGYVFLDTEDIDALYLQLKAVPRMTRLLGVGERIVPLSEEEEAFLMRFGGEAHLVEMSEGIIERSQVRILSGPLMGMEGLIRKIDRHKRKAWLEVELFGRTQRIEVGLEVPMKIV
ncbi:MAG: antiterminator LoaP [Lachnospiraceae bacterium]|nr:antiterminator LoaP [Lachnospiraceae bacterium]